MLNLMHENGNTVPGYFGNDKTEKCGSSAKFFLENRIRPSHETA